MKKAFLLMEVLISIVLLSGVILALFKVNDNGYAIVEKIDKKAFEQSVVGMIALTHQEFSRANNTIFAKDLVAFNEDEARRKLNGVKVKLKEKELSSDIKDLAGFSVEQKVYEHSVKADNSLNKKYYTIELK